MGGDAELGVHLPKMPFHGVRAEEQLGADLGVGEPLAGQMRDLDLLRGERRRGGTVVPGHRLAGGPQLADGAFGERTRTEPREQRVCLAQLLPGVGAAALPPQPFPVQQVRPGGLHRHPAAAEPFDRLPVQLLCCFPPLSSARERVWTPNAQCVAAASVVSVSRTSAASAASRRPLRTPASTSSTSPQWAATRSCGCALARRAAPNASSYLPRPLWSTAPARCAMATPIPSPRCSASSMLASISGAASRPRPCQAASVIVPYGAKLLPTASCSRSISAVSSAAASSSPAHVWTTTCELSARGNSVSAPTARAVRTWRATNSVQASKSHISAARAEASHDQRRTSSGSDSRRNARRASCRRRPRRGNRR